MNVLKRYVPSRCAAYRQIGNEVVIVNTIANKIITLNDTGSVIWMMLNGRTVQEIAADLVDVFDVETQVAACDVEMFLEDMMSRGLVIEKTE